MELLKDYDIDLSKLNLGQFNYSFHIDNKFFELFEYSLVDRGSLVVELLLEKKTSFITLAFQIKGTVKLICDRSLDAFDFNLKTENEIVLKYGEEARELTDEIETIPFKTLRVNIARYIYEFINVAIPMKKLHPRYSNESAEDQIIFSSNDDKEDNLDMDPRWGELKKLRNKE